MIGNHQSRSNNPAQGGTQREDDVIDMGIFLPNTNQQSSDEPPPAMSASTRSRSRTDGVSPRQKYRTPVQLPLFIPAAGD